MNRITKTRIEKQRENKRQGKTFGIKIKDFAKMFKRKEILRTQRRVRLDGN